MSYGESAPSSEARRPKNRPDLPERPTLSSAGDPAVRRASPPCLGHGVPLPRALIEGHPLQDGGKTGCSMAPLQTPLQRISLTVSTVCRFCKTKPGQG